MRRTLEDLGAEIEQRWTQLGAADVDSRMKVLDLPQQVTSGPLLLGVATDGSRLLVPLAPDANRSFRVETTSRGVQLRLRQLEQDEGNHWYLDVVCLRSELRWLFSSFVADMLVRFERQPEVPPASIVRTCYIAWRALFAGTGPRMTVKQVAGLYGELHVLERLLARRTEAAALWKGPLRGAHDFVGPGLDVEVKTTLSDEDEVVHIHGLAQLSAVDTELRLAHLRVETPTEDGESIAEIIDRILTLDASGKVGALINAAGYHDRDRETYADITFRMVEERWFEVDDAFPRLTAAMFPDAVVPQALDDFHYTLDLSAVTAPPMSPVEVESALDVVAG